MKATEPANAATVAPLPKPKADELKELIHDRTEGNPRLRRMMLSQLAKDRKAKVPESRIRAAIEQGTESEGVPL